MADLLDLKIFARVVESGSLSAAGRELQLSPTVVSKRLTRLEEQLGARLIQRTTRQLTLTEVGEGYHEHVLRVLTALEEADAFISGSGDPRGLLRVSAPTGFGRLHIAPRLKPFLRAYPEVRLELDLSDDYVDLIAGGFDVVVRIGSLEDSSMVARKLAPNRRLLVATPDYLAERGEPVTLADLDRHQVLTTMSQPEWHLDGPDGAIVYRPASLLLTNSSEVVREGIVSGLGIGLRSTWDISEELRAGKLKRVLPNHAGSSRVAIWAIYPSRRLVPPKVRAFIDHLAEIYGPEPYWDQVLG
ncbi:LysR family transcriptional regulator [Sphingomonas sp. MMS24-J13]|uniref:LysR family transcriptional regulator n=1 Tax=Sphingomonas sp. MMS24-J13 TaxID=3238686 RepID=UPI00384B55D4